MFDRASFSDLPAFGVGHSTWEEAVTGCTVFVAPEGATCGVDVRGGGPATRETDLLSPEKMVEEVHAVCLSGGSAFGLEASCGVMEKLASEGIGFKIATATVPIVPGACIFDLLIGEDRWPTKEMGFEAASRALASCGNDPECGSVGVGTGATVGKMGLPEQAMKSGFGFFGLRAGDLVVIANVVVNALGNVVSEDGGWLAGVNEGGKVVDPLEAFAKVQATMQAQQASPCPNTTLGVILTNAKLTKAQATKVSQVAHDGYARAIFPVHTQNDGDAIFTMASNEVEAQTDMVSILAAKAMEEAIRVAVS